MSFVTCTQTEVHVVYFKTLQIPFLEISYCDLVNLCHSVCIIYDLAPVLSNF